MEGIELIAALGQIHWEFEKRYGLMGGVNKNEGRIYAEFRGNNIFFILVRSIAQLQL